MPEDYAALKREIIDLDSRYDNYRAYLQRHCLKKEHHWPSTDMALDIAKRAFLAGLQTILDGDGRYHLGYVTAASDPSAWFVKDCEGNAIHIGDRVVHKVTDEFYSDPATVEALGKDCLYDDEAMYVELKNALKIASDVASDTKKKIIDDLAAVKYDRISGSFEEAQEWANGMFDRICAVGVDQ